MIYIYMGTLIVLMGMLSFIFRFRKPGFLFGYQSYFSKINTESETKAQEIYRQNCFLIGIAQILLGLLIKYTGLDHYFLIWLLTFYFSIILVYGITETRLRKFLVSRGMVSKEEIEKIDKKSSSKKRVKGFKDL